MEDPTSILFKVRLGRGLQYHFSVGFRGGARELSSYFPSYSMRKANCSLTEPVLTVLKIDFFNLHVKGVNYLECRENN